MILDEPERGRTPPPWFRALSGLGIAIRADIHTGECEVEGDKLAGMAVHIAARIQAAAEPGEILVSSTVRECLLGSDRRFEDRGEHILKGVEGSWHLYEVVR